MGWTINGKTPEELGVTVADWSIDALGASEWSLDVVKVDYTDDVPPELVYNSLVTIKLDGQQLFKGRVKPPARSMSPESEGLSYIVRGAMYDLDKLVFQQERNYVQSITTVNDNETSIIQYAPCFVGLAMFEADEPLGARVSEIVSYAASRGVDIAVGAIASGIDAQRIEYKDQACGELIRSMMSLMPEYVFWIDFRQPTPTANVTLRSSMDSIQYDINAANIILNNGIQSHEDEVVPGVAIRYEQPLSLDGVNETGCVLDVAGDIDVVGSVIETVPLNGKSASYEYEQVTTRAVPQADADDSDILKWWIEQVPELAQISEAKGEAALLSILKLPQTDISADNVYKHTLKVLESEHDTLEPINPRSKPVKQSTDSSDYSRQLLSGSLPEWSGKRVRKVQAKATLGIKSDVFNAITDEEIKKLLSSLFKPGKTYDGSTYHTSLASGDFVGTNAQKKTYKRNVTADAGEEPPAGIAAQLLAQWSKVRHSGTLTLKGVEIATLPRLGMRLNLTGGRSEWTSMSEPIQSINYSIESGETNITFGAPRSLTASDLVGRLKAFRNNGYSHGLRADRENTEGVGGTIGSVANNFRLIPPAEETSNCVLGSIISDADHSGKKKFEPGYISGGGANIWIEFDNFTPVAGEHYFIEVSWTATVEDGVILEGGNMTGAEIKKGSALPSDNALTAASPSGKFHVPLGLWSGAILQGGGCGNIGIKFCPGGGAYFWRI